MSLWSISAAKKKDEQVPGTSKWIRKELYTLHELMINSSEQFAYSVASELTWIDEQMEEILKQEEENPRLLLESPSKLRGENSPAKKWRDKGTALLSPQKSPSKSPMRELDVNALRLSPIKFEKSQPIPQVLKVNTKMCTSEPEEQVIQKHSPTKVTSTLVKSVNPFLEQPQPVSVISKLVSPQLAPLPPLKQAPRIYSPEEESTSHVPAEKKMLRDNHSEDDNEDYDASVDELSFQPIRTNIPRISTRAASEEANTTAESSYKSADEGSRPSSMAVQPSSTLPGSSIGSVPSQADSVETIKVPLKDEKKKKSIASRTPPPAKRESQGFALLPHRDPLTVKSAKKNDGQKPRLSLFDDEFNFSTSKEEKLTPAVNYKSLYPTISLETTNPSTAASLTSPVPKSKRKLSPTKLQEPSLIPLNIRLASPSKPTPTVSTKAAPTLKSPIKTKSPLKLDSPKKNTAQSPISNLFASVNSTLKKARNKFIRETGKVLDEPSTAGALISAVSPKDKGEDVDMMASPSKNSTIDHPMRQTRIPSHTTSVPSKHVQHDSEKDAKEKATELENADHEENDDDILRRESLKFSPVKSAYGYLRREMNESPKKVTVPDASNNGKVNDVKKTQQPRNLTRVSLAKPDDNQHPRKSRGGLASMSLEPKAKPSRPKSLVGDQYILPSKRKSQTDDEACQTNRGVFNQPYRKISVKIVPPKITQTQQNQQDAKRRRTAEQIQNVLKKRASRVSHTGQQPPAQVSTTENEAARVIKPIPKYALPNNQTLMKTAVLQHARLNNEGKTVNPFQNSSAAFQTTGYSKMNPPVTPSAPTALPEIFSDTDEDEEGSVLKDWANSPELRNILINQQHMDPDKVFGPIVPLQMEEIFQSSNATKLKNRGSSAQWTRDGLTTQEIENYNSRTYKR